jgi:hypothetical protein
VHRVNFRDVVRASGVSPRDLSNAVQKARQTTRTIRTASGVLVEVLTRVGQKTTPGTRTDRVVQKSTSIVVHIHAGLSSMLGERR